VLRTTRMLTLSGPGGIGKTRLALRALHALAGDFPDGTWYVELAGVASPGLVVSAVASAAGVAEEHGRPLLDTLADALRPRRMLLALDNCEHLLDACASLCHRLLAAAPELRLLTTSREPLRVAGEVVWQVPPLPLYPRLSDAARLFAQRAAASAPGFALLPSNAEAVAEICRRLDGIPLAIELAAARVRALTVPQILERLGDRFTLLTTGDRDAPPRQRTLRAAIDWSHSLLDDRERILLRRLSVFTGWSLEMAESVCADAALPASAVIDALAALVDKSLVVRDPDVTGQARYRMLDTIGAYAAEKLAAAGETAVFRARLRGYVLAVSERGFAVGMAIAAGSWRDRVNIFHRYDADAGNAWLVLGQCLAGHQPETGLRIAVAISPCLLVRGEYARGCQWIDAFLDSPGAAAVPPGVRGAALVCRAQLTVSLDPAAAEAPARTGLELCRAAGDTFWTVAALNVMSEICGHTGHPEEAEALGAQALALARAAGDAWGEGWALAVLAVIAGLRGQTADAADRAGRSLRVMREIDHHWGAARAQLVLASLDRMQGDLAGARDRYLQALAQFREIGARPDIARCLSGLGRVALGLGDIRTARDRMAESLRLARDTGSRIGVARGLEAFADLAIREQDPERAVLLAAAACSLRETAGLPGMPASRAGRFRRAASGLPAGPDGLWAAGGRLSPEAALALALAPGQTVPGQPVPPSVPRQFRPVTGLPGANGCGNPSLTPRELQITALVASGRSNKAIAGELFISPATVARHIANIMRKLGVRSRTQIAAWELTRNP
jgi:predicted ATPase/DNA-binding CsgD family transcriptional regulator